MSSEAEAFTVEPFHQINFGVEAGGHVTFVVTHGWAEVNGCPLATETTHNVSGPRSFSVETMTGFALTVTRREQCSVKKHRLETYKLVKGYSTVIANLSHAARVSGAEGPCVLVFGPGNSDRTKFCQSVLNACIANEQCPTFVDLDVSDNSLGPLGTVSYKNFTSGKPLDLLFEIPKCETLRCGSRDNTEEFVGVLDHLESLHRRRQAEDPDVGAGALVIRWRCESSGREEVRGILNVMMRFKTTYLMYTGDDATFGEIKALSKCESRADAVKIIPRLTPGDDNVRKALESGRSSLFERKYLSGDLTECATVFFENLKIYCLNDANEFERVALNGKMENKFMCAVRAVDVHCNRKHLHLGMAVWVKGVSVEKKTVVLRACRNENAITGTFLILDYDS